MKCMSSNRDAYTILEIVIAISLIAIFVALPIFAYSTFMKRSRDAQRKSDVSKIQAALEEYKIDNGVYPVDLGALVDEGYLAELPVDPLDGQIVPGTENTRFGYENNYAVSENGNSYTLSVPLEEYGASAQTGGGGPGGGGSGSGPVYIVVNPGGTKTIPLPTEGLLSPTFQLQPTNTLIPTSFYSPTPTNTPTRTPTPTSTNTPSPTNTPTPTNTSTPSPTPRNCWGINGNCDVACTAASVTLEPHYTSCSVNSSCWMVSGRRCGNVSGFQTSSSYNQTNENYWAQCDCQGTTYSITYYSPGGFSCSSNGSGTCYEMGDWAYYSPIAKSVNRGGCFNATSSCSSPGSGYSGVGYGILRQCSWQNNASVCGTTYTPSNPVSYYQPNFTCSTNGSGTCYKVSSPVTTYTGGGASPCATATKYATAQQCTWLP